MTEAEKEHYDELSKYYDKLEEKRDMEKLSIYDIFAIFGEDKSE